MRRTPISLALLSLCVASAWAQPAAEQQSTLADQQSVAVTIYNENLALVKDTRKLRINTGNQALAFRDVSARMRSETAQFRSLSSPGGLYVLEQNFDFDLLTPQKLLEKYVGKTVSVIRTNPSTGVETQESAQVLAANGGVVMKFADRIETGVPGRIAYNSVPENLRDRPTLVMSLNNTVGQSQDVELSYLTSGLAWKADYVAELNANDDRLDLSGWVTLTNTSGATYRNARLQLVAGDVNQAPPENRGRLGGMAPMGAMAVQKSAPDMASEDLFEYHLYTLASPTTIAENQTKQVSLLSASGAPVRKEFLLQGMDYYYQSAQPDIGTKLKVGVFVEFDNKEASRLGMPLPKGVVRVYKRDSAGNAQFIGEDRIDHTAKNETVRLKLGEAFDVTAGKKQTDFKRKPREDRFSSVFESGYEITLKNAKKEAVTVTVQEPMSGDWQVISESHPHTKSSSNAARWNVTVPANGKAILTYRVVVRY
jgi:hypothetical protein